LLVDNGVNCVLVSAYDVHISVSFAIG